MSLRPLLERDLSAALGGLHDMLRAAGSAGALYLDRSRVLRLKDQVGMMCDLARAMESELAAHRLGEQGVAAQAVRNDVANELIAGSGTVVTFPVIARPIPPKGDAS